MALSPLQGAYLQTDKPTKTQLSHKEARLACQSYRQMTSLWPSVIEM